MSERMKPYSSKAKIALKFIMVPEDMEAESHPIWEIAKQLKSTYRISVKAEDSVAGYVKTRDLDSAGGIIYMLHKDENVVMNELNLLRRIERDYFKLLLSDGMARRWFSDAKLPEIDPEKLMESLSCHGSILLAVDEYKDIPGAQVVTPDTLNDANNGFDHVIIAYQRSLLNMNDSACMKLIFETMAMVRLGGQVIIPKSTYRYMAYEREGAEVLMQVKGLEVTAPMPGFVDYVVGTKCV